VTHTLAAAVVKPSEHTTFLVFFVNF
jgi:hypothetical protein